jgi:UDP-N-acetylglucosamine:LPS N-acetylglucosamine transferase
MMASLLGRPLVLHEQNSIAGLANKVLAKVADRVLCAFPDALPNSEWTGNPVRAELAQIPAPESRYDHRTGPLRVLVVGGSLGAAALNDVVPKALALLPEASARSSSTRPARNRSIRCARTTPRRAWPARPCHSSTTWRRPMPTPIWSSAAPAR